MKTYTISCPPRPEVIMRIQAESADAALDKFEELLDERDDVRAVKEDDKCDERDLSELSEAEQDKIWREEEE